MALNTYNKYLKTKQSFFEGKIKHDFGLETKVMFDLDYGDYGDPNDAPVLSVQILINDFTLSLMDDVVLNPYIMIQPERAQHEIMLELANQLIYNMEPLRLIKEIREDRNKAILHKGNNNSLVRECCKRVMKGE